MSKYHFSQKFDAMFMLSIFKRKKYVITKTIDFYLTRSFVPSEVIK